MRMYSDLIDNQCMAASDIWAMGAPFRFTVLSGSLLVNLVPWLTRSNTKCKNPRHRQYGGLV